MLRRPWRRRPAAPGPASGGSRAALPPGVRIYAVGDIHGRADLLDGVLAAIDRHRAQASPARCIEVFLGDYVDRGNDARGVIERLVGRSREGVPGRDVMTLCGNHEEMLLACLEQPASIADWARNGGLETLLSYGVAVPARVEAKAGERVAADLRRAMPEHHLRFLRALGDSFRCGDYFFVHAGVRPGAPLDRQDRRDLLWIRDEFLDSREDFGAIVVHGHTPVRQVEMRPNRINLDTGAYITGALSCLVLEGAEREVLPARPEA